LGSHTILVCPYHIFRWGPPNKGVKCRLGRQSTNIWLSYQINERVVGSVTCYVALNLVTHSLIIITIIIIMDLYSAFRSEDTEALEAAQED